MLSQKLKRRTDRPTDSASDPSDDTIRNDSDIKTCKPTEKVVRLSECKASSTPYSIDGRTAEARNKIFCQKKHLYHSDTSRRNNKLAF